MGIKDFTKVFPYNKKVTFKELRNKKIALDANAEIWRAMLGMSKITALTDPEGNTTVHINVILLLILKLQSFNIEQVWVFDYRQPKKEKEFHNPLKQLELKKRAIKKQKAKEKILEVEKKIKNIKNIIKSNLEENLFSDDEDEKKYEEQIIAHEKEIEKKKKQVFTLSEEQINDIKFILNMLSIKWINCCSGFDAEQLCAMLTYNDKILGTLYEYVLTSDADSLLFGAKKILKKNIKDKCIYEFNLENILKVNNLTLDDLIKIGLILGSDFAPKTPGIGHKTVLKKFKNIELSNEQIQAMNQNFKRQITDEEIKSLEINNEQFIPFADKTKILSLIEWLEIVKGFNKERILKSFANNKINIYNEEKS